jgi:F-type H+-transporting ATPase subunit gamma
MSTCHKILSQKRALQSIMRITQTMQTVALAKVTHGQYGLKQLRIVSQYWNKFIQLIKKDEQLEPIWYDFFQKYPYLESLKNISEKIFHSQKNSEKYTENSTKYDETLLQFSSEKHHVYVIGSDRGFCGGLLVQLGQKAHQWITFLENSGKTVNLSFVGKKTLSMYSRRFSSEKTAHLWQGLDKNRLSNPTVQLFIEEALKCAENGETLWVVYSRFRSILSQEIVCELISPWGEYENLKKIYADKSQNSIGPQKDNENEFEKKSNSEKPLHYGCMSYDPLPEEAIEAALKTNWSLRIRNVIWEAFTSEQASRFLNMKNASQNAQRMIKSLSQEYNRARQTKITVELIEVVAGAKS